MWFWNTTWKICVLSIGNFIANLRHHLKKMIGCLGNKQMRAEDSTIKVPITSQFDPEFAFELNNYWLVVSTLWKILVSWDDYSQYMENWKLFQTTNEIRSLQLSNPL